jgi:hypothetical protein
LEKPSSVRQEGKYARNKTWKRLLVSLKNMLLGIRATASAFTELRGDTTLCGNCGESLPRCE